MRTYHIETVGKDGYNCDVDEYTFEEWMEKFRPDGKGYIRISGMDAQMNPSGEITDIEFDEVVCDFCNREIKKFKKFKMKECATCKGTGKHMGQRCPICNGSGEIFTGKINKVWVVGNNSICESCWEECYKNHIVGVKVK